MLFFDKVKILQVMHILAFMVIDRIFRMTTKSGCDSG